MAKKKKEVENADVAETINYQEKFENIPEGLKSLSLQIENFKNIDKMVVEIGGRSLLIIGKNGAGKSSFIQAMTSGLNTKTLPPEPIKAGEDHAKISHRIGGNMHGEYQEYVLDIYFTPKDKTGRLVVTNSKGETMKSPAAFVKTLIGNVSFDVTKWLNDTKAKRLETIKNLTGCGKDIDMINIEIKRLKEDKKYKSDRAKQLEGSLTTHEFDKAAIELYSQPVDLNPIQARLQQVVSGQGTWDGINAKLVGFNNDLLRSEEAVRLANEEIKRLYDLLEFQNNKIDNEHLNQEKLKSNIAKGNEWLSVTQRPSIEAVNEEMNLAIQHNERHNRIGMLGIQQKEMINLKTEVDAADSLIEAQENKRSQLISQSQLPIQGLTFSDEELFIDGLPLEEGQQNTQKLFDIGVEVAMALNPNLKVIFLHEASLFDNEQLATIIRKIEDKGYQAICEIVSSTGDELHVEFTETALN